jgi:hypothetical protein
MIDQKIIFTGDIHHMSMNGCDQIDLSKIDKNISEVKLCNKYLEILNYHGFEPILFFTGKCLIEELSEIKYLMKNYKFYFGGHTYNAYKPKIIFRSFYRIFGTYYPFKFLQNMDISYTKKLFYEKLGVDIKIWRNHAYVQDKNTNKLLKLNGIDYVSNDVNLSLHKPYIVNQIKSLPINTYPDHENLIHSADHKINWDLNLWYQKNINQIKYILDNDGTATILAHPLCLYLEDKLNTFDDFVKKAKNLIDNL